MELAENFGHSFIILWVEFQMSLAMPIVLQITLLTLSLSLARALIIHDMLLFSLLTAVDCAAHSII